MSRFFNFLYGKMARIEFGCLPKSAYKLYEESIRYIYTCFLYLPLPVNKNYLINDAYLQLLGCIFIIKKTGIYLETLGIRSS